MALPVEMLWNDEVLVAMLVYALSATGTAFAFRRASRITVGIDGVRVHGTSRTRYYAYRDLDEVRLVGGALALVRKERVLLTLQICGDDAVRREAIVARIAAAIARARDPGASSAARFVEARSRNDVVRAASGGSDYRASAITREQLWGVVEGPTSTAIARAAAAEALVATKDPSERARLRVAAAACADPRTRVALERLAEDDAEVAQVDVKARTIPSG
jgi:hypothetical protein